MARLSIIMPIGTRSKAEGFVEMKTKPLIGWGYLIGGFNTPAEASVSWPILRPGSS